MPKTLRLLMPQWQGGNNPDYYFGAKLLDWLAPLGSDTVSAEVPVEPHTGEKLPVENGIVARSVLLRQLSAAAEIIERHRPERIIALGGDCLVAQAPFSYLNDRYDGRLGVLWIDAHPDVSTPALFSHAHAMVLGNLLGEGDADFAAQIGRPLLPERVMFGGLQRMNAEEAAIVDRLGIRKAGPKELAEDSAPVLEWIRENRISRLAVHLDLDVLDPRFFRSLLFTKPESEPIDAPSGEMTLAQLTRLFRDIAPQTEMVGLSIAEYLPWDEVNLSAFLKTLPIFA